MGGPDERPFPHPPSRPADLQAILAPGFKGRAKERSPTSSASATPPKLLRRAERGSEELSTSFFNVFNSAPDHLAASCDSP